MTPRVTLFRGWHSLQGFAGETIRAIGGVRGTFCRGVYCNWFTAYVYATIPRPAPMRIVQRPPQMLPQFGILIAQRLGRLFLAHGFTFPRSCLSFQAICMAGLQVEQYFAR